MFGRDKFLGNIFKLVDGHDNLIKCWHLGIDDLGDALLRIYNANDHDWVSLLNRSTGCCCLFFATERTLDLSARTPLPAAVVPSIIRLRRAFLAPHLTPQMPNPGTLFR
jgi:hypothetical protein